MNALIIGGAGFVGYHLIDHLRQYGWSINVSKLPGEELCIDGVRTYDLDILDFPSTKQLLEDLRPDCVFHLAAQSSVALSWSNPGLTVDVNIKGTLHLLEALRTLNSKPRTLIVGSGEEYGHVYPDEIPISEDNVLRPGNIYAATKACGGMLSSIYAQAYDLDIITVRAFSHIGPGQSPQFVVGDFCKQMAEIEAGIRQPFIQVGNLSACRDFTDVRDVVRAYRLLIEQGQGRQTYNVGSGKAIAVQEVLNVILAQAKIAVTVEVAPAKFRPVDIPVIEADIAKVKADTGWRTEIPLEETVAATLEFWRTTIGK